MRSVVTDRVGWSVCHTCEPYRNAVCHTCEPYRNGWTDRNAVSVVDSGGPKGTLAPPGEYEWTVHLWQRCGLVSDYFDHLFTLLTATAIILYGSTCVSRHPQLWNGRFCWSKVLLPACTCWWQLAHSVYGEDHRVLVSGVTYNISIPLTTNWKLKLEWM